MNARMNWMLLVMAVALPAGAWAQHGSAPAPQANQATRPAPHAGEDLTGVGDAWSEDDKWFALGLDDELFLGAHDAGEDSSEESIGPEGERRIVRRHVVRRPGGRMGLGRHMGAHGGMGMHGLGTHLMNMRERWGQLDLTETQRGRIHDLHEAQARKGVQRRADTQLARMDLHKLMRAERPNSAAVNAQIDKLARMRADGMKAAFDTRMQARAILTPDQLKQLRAAPGPTHMRHEMGDFEESKKR